MGAFFGKDDLTLLGAAIAALTGIANLVWQWGDRNDRIVVRCGALQPVIDDYNSLYIVNTGKHPVELKNYGFLLVNGRLMSLPYHLELEGSGYHFEHSYTKGNLRIPPSENFEAGLEYRGRVIGAWAITATQLRPRLAFSFDTPLWQRVWLTARHFVRPAYI